MESGPCYLIGRVLGVLRGGASAGHVVRRVTPGTYREGTKWGENGQYSCGVAKLRADKTVGKPRKQRETGCIACVVTETATDEAGQPADWLVTVE